MNRNPPPHESVPGIFSRRRSWGVVPLLAATPLLWFAVGAAAPDADKPAAPGGHPAESKDEHEHGDEHKGEVKLTPEAVRRYGLRTGVARKHKLAASFVAPARVCFNAEATAVVGSAVTGRVVDLKARVGDEVKKGDELLAVESPELAEAQGDYLQKVAALSGARAVIDPARGAAERAKSLYEGSGGISLTELQKREVEYAAARNNLLVAQAAADAARNKLGLLGLDDEAVGRLEGSKKINPRYSVHSPLAGRVIERPVTLGELVKPDREKLVVVADTTTLWVIADVPEARLREVAPGAKATVTVAAAGEQPYDGTVSHVAATVDPATRSIPVRVEVKADPPLKPGQFAQVEIAARPPGGNGDAAVLAVPEGAVQIVDGSAAVFTPVRGEANTYAVRKVAVGPAVAGMVPVTSGLTEGERIVTAGTFILKADLGKAGAKDED